MPAGVGGPLSPVVTNAAAAGRATAGTSVATNALELGVLGEPQTNLSMQGTIAQSNGTAVPIYDPALVGQFNWTHQTTPQTSLLGYGTNALVTNTTLANAGIQQGFATGAQVGLNFNNNHQNLNSLNTGYNPFTGSSLGLTVTQPLLRGFGASLNRRFIRIAGNEQQNHQPAVPAAADRHGLRRDPPLHRFRGAVRRREGEAGDRDPGREAALRYARRRWRKARWRRWKLTRANAQVFSARQDLINARGLREEQEAILKNVLTRRGNEDPEVRAARIIPTDTLSIPDKDEIRPMQDLIADALAEPARSGPGASCRWTTRRSACEGARSLTRPEVDLVGIMQNNGLAGPVNPLGAEFRSRPSAAATAARSSRCSRANIRPTASACR